MVRRSRYEDMRARLYADGEARVSRHRATPPLDRCRQLLQLWRGQLHQAEEECRAAELEGDKVKRELRAQVARELRSRVYQLAEAIGDEP